MSDALVTYVDDHLAGARFAINLLEEIRDWHPGQPLGLWAATLLAEIESDYETLQNFAHQLGSKDAMKKMSAWLVEKVSRFKLRHDGDGLGTFEALEFLTLGIQGKMSLWRALAALGPEDPRVLHLDLAHLIARAQDQYAQAEERRLQAAKDALRHSDLNDSAS